MRAPLPHANHSPRRFFDQLRYRPLYSTGSARRSSSGCRAGTLCCVHSLFVHRIDGFLRAGRSSSGVGVAPTKTPGSITIRRDLKLERVIGCAEANLSAQADQAHPQVWLPGPHGRSRRPRRVGPATAQGTPRAHRRGREQVHAESLGGSPARGDRSSAPAGGRQLAVSRSRRVQRGTRTSATARRRCAHGTVAREGRCRGSIGPSLSSESHRSTPQSLWRRRWPPEWWFCAAKPAEAGDARGIASVAFESPPRLRPGRDHPRNRQRASWVGRGAATAGADVAQGGPAGPGSHAGE
jgi:hypothetical protein